MTDEAPALATVSLLPILQAFSKSSDVKFESRDISLSSRILATFNDFLGSKIKYENDLEFLGKLVKDPDANIIKLPNISASIPHVAERNKIYFIHINHTNPILTNKNGIRDLVESLGFNIAPVSYTHLTLPTMIRV